LESYRRTVFVFSAATGGGHDLAAKSLKEIFEKNNTEVKLFDAFKESNKVLDSVVVNGYRTMVENTPQLYGKLYYTGNNIRLNSYVIDIISKIMDTELISLINSNTPDLIIVTHPLVANVLGTLKQNNEFDVPIISIVTDYKIHTTYIHDMIDAYIVGSEYTKNTMIERGMNPEKIYCYGIPVAKDFSDKNNIHLTKQVVPLVEATILLMAGSFGTRHMEKAFLALLRSEKRLKIYVVCGKNKKIKKHITLLNKLEKTNTKIVEIYGYVNNIPELMDDSDAIITKPGGLTTTEAITKNIPMIIPYYYPGQEKENADYLVEAGMAIKLEKVKDLTSIINFLIQHKYVLNEMAKKMSEESQKHSIEKIVELSLKIIEKSQVSIISKKEVEFGS
jgi:processive 1,2-diacylglycerol beta-glucosyltransferase